MIVTQEHLKIYRTILDLAKTQDVYMMLVCVNLGLTYSCVTRRINHMIELGWLRRLELPSGTRDRKKVYLEPLLQIDELPTVGRKMAKRIDPMIRLRAVYNAIHEFIASGNLSPTLEQIGLRAYYERSAVDYAVKILCIRGYIERRRIAGNSNYLRRTPEIVLIRDQVSHAEMVISEPVSYYEYHILKPLDEVT